MVYTTSCLTKALHISCKLAIIASWLVAGFYIFKLLQQDYNVRPPRVLRRLLSPVPNS